MCKPAIGIPTLVVEASTLLRFSCSYALLVGYDMKSLGYGGSLAG